MATHSPDEMEEACPYCLRPAAPRYSCEGPCRWRLLEVRRPGGEQARRAGRMLIAESRQARMRET